MLVGLHFVSNTRGLHQILPPPLPATLHVERLLNFQNIPLGFKMLNFDRIILQFRLTASLNVLSVI